MIKTPNSLLYSQWDAMQLRNPTTHRTWKYNKKIKRKKDRYMIKTPSSLIYSQGDAMQFSGSSKNFSQGIP